MLVYCNDFDETPPFVLQGSGDDDDEELYVDNPDFGSRDNQAKETWLAAASTMQRIYVLPEEDWYTADHPRLPQSGDLYEYARFPDLYVCPEVERVRNVNKTQNAFSYTRNFLGRKMDVNALVSLFKKRYLKVLKVSDPYNPGALPMMVDEAWDCYVAWAEDYGWVWGGHDPICELLDSCMGQYHGATIPGWARFAVTEPEGSVNGAINGVPLKQANVSFYDGHVGLMRDPLPNVEHEGGRPPMGYGLLPYDVEYLRWIGHMLYAQQGLAVPF
jgi:prepilin-type processing-associated H-X9-DG protein